MLRLDLPLARRFRPEQHLETACGHGNRQRMGEDWPVRRRQPEWRFPAFIVQRILMPDSLPPEVMRRAVREMLVLSRLEERRLCEAGGGEAWKVACDAVDDWLECEGALDVLSDPGALTAGGWWATKETVRSREEKKAAQPSLQSRGAG